MHLGECEVTDDAVRGISVHIGARVAASAKAGEVLVSSTLKEAMASSEIGFNNRGAYELKGIPGEWRLFTVEPNPDKPELKIDPPKAEWMSLSSVNIKMERFPHSNDQNKKS